MIQMTSLKAWFSRHKGLLHMAPTLRRLSIALVLCVFAYQKVEAQEIPPKFGSKEPALFDRDGEPLPAGAIARLGSLHFRHGASLRDLAVSPDGKVLVTVAAFVGSEIRFWEMATGKEIRRLKHPTARAVAFSPDGSKLASIGVHEPSAVGSVDRQ